MTYQISKITYTCKWCHKIYLRENAYMAHECKQMKREAELKTPIGQSAFDYYQTWMRVKKRHSFSPTSFLASNYFRTFIKFVEFTKQVKLPLPDTFIKLMVQRDFPPTMWTNDEVYSQYISFLDSNIDPIDQVALSIETLFKYADKQDIDISNVFEAINPNELIQMIRIRQVSPWLLLASKKFANFFANMNQEQQSITESLINPDVWAKKSLENQTQMKAIKIYTDEIGI
jgi:hypothetical protein